MHNAAIGALGQAGRWQEAVSLLATVPRWDQVLASTAVSVVTQWDQALLLLGRLGEWRLRSTLLTHTPVLKTCGEASQWPWALHLLQQLELEMRSDLVMCTAAINACAAAIVWPHALLLFHGLAARALLPDRVAYTATISACGKADQWQRVLQLLSQSQAAGVSPDSTSFVAAISACTDSWQHAIELLRQSYERQVHDIGCYNAAISASSRSHWQLAILLLGSAEEARQRADAVTYTAAISSCERFCQWRHAYALFCQMSEQDQSATVITYNLLISAFAKGEQWQTALLMLSELEGNAVRSNLITQGVAINALARGLQWRVAMTIMSSGSNVPSVVTFGTLINAFQVNLFWEHALIILRSMPGMSVQPSLACYDYAMMACEGVRSDLARQLLSESEDRSPVSLLWGASLVRCLGPDAVHSACTAAARWAAGRLSPRELATAWWSAAVVGASNDGFGRTLVKQASQQIYQFDIEELSMVVAAAASDSSNIPFLCLAQGAAAQMLDTQALDISFGGAGKELLGILFSCRLCGCLQASVREAVHEAMLRAGQRRDVQRFSQPKPSPQAPDLTVLNLPDRAVLFKPPGWEAGAVCSLLQCKIRSSGVF